MRESLEREGFVCAPPAEPAAVVAEVPQVEDEKERGMREEQQQREPPGGEDLLGEELKVDRPPVHKHPPKVERTGNV